MTPFAGGDICYQERELNYVGSCLYLKYFLTYSRGINNGVGNEGGN